MYQHQEKLTIIMNLYVQNKFFFFKSVYYSSYMYILKKKLLTCALKALINLTLLQNTYQQLTHYINYKKN